MGEVADGFAEAVAVGLSLGRGVVRWSSVSGSLSSSSHAGNGHRMKLPQSPRAVVFDMDGLLFDTETLYIRSLITAAAEYGYEMTWDLYRPMLGSPWHVNRHSLLLQYGPSFPVDDVRSLWLEHFSVLCQTELALKAGVSELLDLLDELDLPRAIATSSFRHSVDHHLEAHGLTPFPSDCRVWRLCGKQACSRSISSRRRPAGHRAALLSGPGRFS